VKEYKIFIKLNPLLLLGVQINLVSLPLINFRKFDWQIWYWQIYDEKWVLCDSLKRRKSWIDSD